MADWDAMADRKRRAAERKASVRDQIKAKKAGMASQRLAAQMTDEDAPRIRAAGHGGGMTAGPVVGPNAILQTAAALDAQGGRALARQVFAAAGLGALLDAPPEAMVPEAQAVALMRALHATLPPEAARRVSREAGRRTGAYILRHRIPAPARGLLRLLPARLAAPLLLRAVAAHAWTFAGSGRVEIAGGDPARLMIHDNPLAVRGSDWHRAVLEVLFQSLVHPRARVTQTASCATEAGACTFEIATGRPRRAARVAGPGASA